MCLGFLCTFVIYLFIHLFNLNAFLIKAQILCSFGFVSTK